MFLPQAGVTLGPGELMGEIGLLSSHKRRTSAANCATDVELLSLSEDVALQLYFQNPAFGFFLLRLITDRLVAPPRPPTIPPGSLTREELGL